MRRLRYSLGALLAVLWTLPLHAQAPTGRILGHITDAATQQPITGVTVSFGSRSTLTKTDGSYLLSGVAAGTDSLRARMIGYSPIAQSVELGAGQTLVVDLAMTARALNLAEMVVIGYGEQAAGNITGAVTNVTAEEFNTGRIVTPTELIQNKVAGVQVVENNEPGGGTTIRIRGATSVNASSDPLIVIDGMPLGGSGSGGGISGGRDPLNYVNGDDIESITVLRDASAAAIYGANAANGVVIITTKRARAGQKPEFEYTGTVSASSSTRYPSMLNASQFRAAVAQYAPANVSQLGAANTDWFDQVDRTGYGQEHNFAVAGAGTSSRYRLSANYLDQDGIIQGTNTKRLGLGLNYDQLLFSDRVNVKVNVRGSRQADAFTPGGVLSNAAQMGPTQPVLDSLTPTGYFDWSGGIQSADNPVAILNLATDNSTTYRGVGNLQGSYRAPFIEGLKANLGLGFDVTKAERTQFTHGELHGEIRNSHFGNFYRTNPTQLNTVFDAFLDYTVPRSVGPGTLQLTGGYSYGKSHSEYPSVQAESLSTNLLGPNGIPAAKTIKTNLFVEDSKLISFFGRLNYNIKDRYLVAASIRRDGSSRFAETNAWGTFPSLALAWRLSEESFLKSVGWLSDLKLRASWARTGNQSFGNYLHESTFTVGNAQSQYWLGDGFVTTIRPTGVDKNIKWEATRSFDIGLDYGFKNQRFTGAIDWYDKKTTDLIFNLPVAPGTSVSDFVTTNIGAMRNRGIEFSLSARLFNGGPRGLSWTADVNVAHNNNELVEINPAFGTSQKILVGGIAGGVGSTIQILTPGVPMNSFFVYQHRRGANGRPVYSDQDGDNDIDDLDLYVDQFTLLDTLTTDGTPDCRVDASCKGLYRRDGVINSNDRRPFHDPAPKWTLGHSSYLAYRNFDLGFTLRAYFGNYVYNNVASNLGSYLEVNRGSPFNLHQSVLTTGFATPQYFSDYYVEKASFLRMDNITLGYSFQLRGLPARAFASVQNVFTITGYDGVDPTAGLNGIDNNIYPRSRTVTSGLSVRF
jgi:iron complex outermembrane receptor protein